MKSEIQVGRCRILLGDVMHAWQTSPTTVLIVASPRLHIGGCVIMASKARSVWKKHWLNISPVWCAYLRKSAGY